MAFSMPDTNTQTTSNGMRIYYVANARIPTEKAHGIQIMSMCEAFASLGHEVTLVVPKRKNTLTDDPFLYYGVAKNFSIEQIATLDFPWIGTISWKLYFLIQHFSFAYNAVRILRNREGIFYGRDEVTLAFLSNTKPVYFEVHTGSNNFFTRRVLSRAQGLVAISGGLARFYKNLFPKLPLLVAHDGVNLANFLQPGTKEAARSKLGISTTLPVALYAGRLDGWKGSDVFLKASELLTGKVQCVVIGSTEFDRDFQELKHTYPKVLFTGFLPYRDLPLYQQAADVLVIPNTATDRISREFTSPLKIFTAMASGIPIVASDIPSIREVLNAQTACLVTPDDTQALAAGITEVLADPQAAQIRADTAKASVAEYDWKRRAQHIVSFIESR